MARFSWILGDSRKIKSCWIFLLCTDAVHTHKGEGNFKSWRTSYKHEILKKTESKNEWMISSGYGWHVVTLGFDVYLRISKFGKNFWGDWIILLVTFLVAVTLSCHDLPKGWTIYSFSQISFFTVGVKETRVLGVCGGHSSYLNRSES